MTYSGTVISQYSKRATMYKDGNNTHVTCGSHS